ncbi:MAG TPA: FHA domain-containing protein [Acidobacteria bacterium]|nr:FHA domain-containing protein [Acidobacteriota bacterium]
MAFRLVVNQGGVVHRSPLKEGGNLVGSRSDCDVRLLHASVSRRHAILWVEDGQVRVEDLGSRNGTWIGGERIQQGLLSAGNTVLFGAVEARLEDLPAGDFEPAMLFDQDGATPDLSASGSRSGTTLTTGLTDAFTLRALPDLAARLAAGAELAEMAQRTGEALFSNLPCLALTISTGSGSEAGILFEAARNGARPPGEAEVAIGEEGLTVHASFPSAQIARAYRPLLEAAVHLITAANRGAPAKKRRGPQCPSPPPLPAPPTVSPAVRTIYESAARVARGEITVLILGESGTGKEVLAQYLHAASPVCDGPFLCLNCAAMPRDLLESELFGVEKGVATGVDARPGKFEQADGGTLFLDEIGDMPPEAQSRLLRVLQSGEVYRLGGSRPIAVKVRVIAATNRDIAAMMAQGTFRTDLYHRIAGWVVRVPPLRERLEDLPNLAAFFLNREARRLGITVRGISRHALDALLAYDWPGNVRELETEMARAVLFLEDGELLDSVRLSTSVLEASAGGGGSLSEILERTERQAIQRALLAAGDVGGAAELLGVSRATLYRRLKALGIHH